MDASTQLAQRQRALELAQNWHAMANDSATPEKVLETSGKFLAFLEDKKRPEPDATPTEDPAALRALRAHLRLKDLVEEPIMLRVDLDALEAAIRRVEIVLRGQPDQGTDQPMGQPINAKQDTAPSPVPTRLENAVAWALCRASYENYKLAAPGNWEDVGEEYKTGFVLSARAAIGEIAKEFMR